MTGFRRRQEGMHNILCSLRLSLITERAAELLFLCLIDLENSFRYGFYRATACNATHGIAVGILSVCPSVCLSVCPSDACIVTKLNNAQRIF